MTATRAPLSSSAFVKGRPWGKRKGARAPAAAAGAADVRGRGERLAGDAEGFDAAERPHVFVEEAEARVHRHRAVLAGLRDVVHAEDAVEVLLRLARGE